MPPVLVTSGKQPFEVTILFAALVAGVALRIIATRPASITASMPPLLQTTWEIGLIACGLLGLVGVFWRGDLVNGQAVELGALFLLGSLTAMYTIALFVVSGEQATAAGSFVAAVAFAAWWRCGQIIRGLRRVAQASVNGDASC